MIIDSASTIKGEATAKGLTPAEGWFEIFSFSWGASNPTTVGSGGGGLTAGRVSVSSFNVMKKSEKSSAALFSACCMGTHFGTAQVVMRKATGTGGQQIFLKYDFTDVLVESIQWSGSSGGDDTPTESLSFSFAKVAIEYSAQTSADGKVSKAANATWDLTAVSA
jgi:type VI secretion system secreted protein Hcp